MEGKMSVKIEVGESLRGFAPSVLGERAKAYFDMSDGDTSRYMLLVAPVREGLRRALGGAEKATMKDPDLRKRVSIVRSSIPAGTHLDCSAPGPTGDERNGRQ